MINIEILIDLIDDIDLVKSEMISNYWGKFDIEGNEIYLNNLYSVVLRYARARENCRHYIEASIVKELIVFEYKGDVWYLDVNEIYLIEGDPWGLGDNVHYNQDKTLADTWNEYSKPNMTTFYGKFRKLTSWKDFIVAYHDAIHTRLEL